MVPFHVPVKGEKLEQARDALEAAGTPRLSVEVGYTDAPEPMQITTVLARAEADDAVAAEAFVREIVGDDFKVGPAKRVGD